MNSMSKRPSPSGHLVWLMLLSSLMQRCYAVRVDPNFRSGTCANDKELQSLVFDDVKRSLSHQEVLLPQEIGLCVTNDLDDVTSAMQDCVSGHEDETKKGELAWRFLRGVANSPTFINEYWHKQPLLFRKEHTGGWVEDFFTVNRDLRLVDDSYISGHKTAEILRNGTDTKTWALAPIKENPMMKTTWKEVDEALRGGTIYFNTAGSLWPNLGGLCRLTGYAFGLPPNVNVYVTPPGMKVSVPPHTDKQDVFVIQTGGAKRWRVFAPPARSKGKDPLHRGKSGDILTFEEMGPPLVDTVLQEGDVLYVPTGFPHTTDTSTVTPDADGTVFEKTSIHLTMGLDSHVWCLTMAYFRWTLLQRLGSSINLDISDDEAYWTAMESIPLGFLGELPWRRTIESLKGGGGIDEEFKSRIASDFLAMLVKLEPKRWGAEGAEKLPSIDTISEVVDFFVKNHWTSLMKNQEMLFSNIDPSSEETIIKAFKGTQEQDLIMEKFGIFSKNDAFTNSFAQRRKMAEERLKGI